MTIGIESGAALNTTQAASPLTLATTQGNLLGFYVNSTSSGTIAIVANGVTLSGTITPAIGFHRFPASIPPGNMVVTMGGTINVTFFFAG